MKSKIDEAKKEAIDYNVTECTAIAKDFNKTIDKVTEKIWRCVHNVIENVEKQKQLITQRSNNVTEYLVDISIKAQLCSGESTDQHFYCVNKVNYLSPK